MGETRHAALRSPEYGLSPSRLKSPCPGSRLLEKSQLSRRIGFGTADVGRVLEVIALLLDLMKNQPKEFAETS